MMKMQYDDDDDDDVFSNSYCTYTFHLYKFIQYIPMLNVGKSKREKRSIYKALKQAIRHRIVFLVLLDVEFTIIGNYAFERCFMRHIESVCILFFHIFSSNDPIRSYSFLYFLCLN